MLSGLITAVPLSHDAWVTLRLSPSTSQSFCSTLTVTGLSSAVVALSVPAVGASFTAATVTVSCPFADPPFPSLTV